MALVNKVFAEQTRKMENRSNARRNNRDEGRFQAINRARKEMEGGQNEYRGETRDDDN